MKTTFYALFLICLIGCSDSNKQIIFPEDIWEKGKYLPYDNYLIDLNNDNKLDTIKLFRIDEWNDAGDFHQIKILFSNNKELDIYNTGDWIKIDKYDLKSFNLVNLIKSDKIIIVQSNDSFKYLFIIGDSFASNPGKLFIIKLNENKSKVIYDNKFCLNSIEELDNDKNLELIGWLYLAEYYGSYDSLISPITYSPFFVQKLINGKVIVDTILSEKYNIENYSGFFGLDFDSENRYSKMVQNPGFPVDSLYKSYFLFEKYRKYPETSLRYFKIEELSIYSKEELRLIRNEIFAFHGYIFNSKDLIEYFSQFSWYKPTEKNVNNRLNIFEKANISLIKGMENNNR